MLEGSIPVDALQVPWEIMGSLAEGLWPSGSCRSSKPDYLCEELLSWQKPNPQHMGWLCGLPYSKRFVSVTPYQQLGSCRVPASGVPPLRQALRRALGADELGQAACGDGDPRRFLAPPGRTQVRQPGEDNQGRLIRPD